MRVLFLTSCDHTQLRYEAEALGSLYDVDYLITKIERLRTKDYLINFIKSFPLIIVVLMKLRIPPIPSKRFISYLFLTAHLNRCMKSKKYDIIYAQWLFPAGFIGLLLSKIVGAKVVSVIWGYDIQVIPRVKGYGIQGLNKIISRFVIEKSNLVLVGHKIHKEAADRLSKYKCQNKIVYIAPAIPDISGGVRSDLTAELRSKLPLCPETLMECPIVLCSPSLEPLYGIIDFIKASHIVASRRRNSVFVVVGNGKLRDEASRLVKELGLEGKVIFLGTITHESMKALYKLAAVVCDISYAGSGTTTLEAFCFGKPVIGMRTPKSFITHGKNGFLIQRGDHEAFGEYIIRILDDQRLSRALSVNARRAFEEKFYINSRLMKLASLFRHLMRDKIN